MPCFPVQIRSLPAGTCQGLEKYGTLVSGNTFGARAWTDGRQVAPMLPRPPAVVTCEICAECYWLKDAREIGGTRTSRSCPAITVAPKASARHEPINPTYDRFR
jgi:hypothetical protein